MQQEKQLKIFLWGLVGVLLLLLSYVVILKLEKRGFKIKAYLKAAYQDMLRYVEKEFTSSQVETRDQPLAASEAQAPPDPSNYFPPPPSQEAPSVPKPNIIKDENLFIKVEVEPKTVYPGQQVLLRCNLYTRHDTRYEGIKDRGSFGGFWIEGFPLDDERVERQEVTENGKRYVRATISKRALFPLAPGKFSIYPGSFDVSYQSLELDHRMTAFTGVETRPARVKGILEAQRLSIQVKDFPSSLEVPSYTGSSGSYEMNSEFIKNGDGTFSLKVRIYGRGNIRQIELPPLNFEPHFAVEGIKEDRDLSYENDVVKGEKTFSIQLYPRSLGSFSIPSIAWTYFDLQRKDFQTLRTKFYEAAVDGLPQRSIQKETASSGLPEILFILDVSGTMLAQDFGAQDRLSVAKKILDLLISRHAGKARMGLLLFAQDAVKAVDVTTAHPSLRQALAEIQVGQLSDGSAYGDALHAALKTFKQDSSSQKRVIVLVTDASVESGSHVESLMVADWLAEQRIPVHVVALYHEGLVPFPVPDPVQGKRFVDVEISPEPSMLDFVAQRTGGKFIHITDSGRIKETLGNLKVFS